MHKNKLKKALLKAGFKPDECKVNAAAGWYESGANEININRLQDIINNLE